MIEAVVLENAWVRLEPASDSLREDVRARPVDEQVRGPYPRRESDQGVVIELRARVHLQADASDDDAHSGGARALSAIRRGHSGAAVRHARGGEAV
jgi:hypothetical protein